MCEEETKAKVVKEFIVSTDSKNKAEQLLDKTTTT
jgi:hypothetical protein